MRYHSPLLAAMLLFSAVLPAVAQTPDYVMLSFSVRDADVRVLLNGFPVLEGSGSGGLPVNLHLVPTDNYLEIEFQPEDSAASFTAGLSTAGAGDITGSDTAGNLLNVELSGAEGAQTVSETFDLPAAWAEAFTTGQRYAALPVLDDEERVRAYAVDLAARFAAGDYARLVEDFRPVARDRYAADPARFASYPLDEFLRLTDAEMERLFQQHTFRTAVAPDSVVLTPWAGGRLWELQHADGQPLLLSESEDGTLFISAYVGEIDGQLRVIR